MLRFVFSSLLALSVLPSVAAAQQTFDVYIVAGQSNTDGRGDVSDLTTAQLASLQTDAIISFLNPGSERERAVPTSNPNDLDVGTNGFTDLVPGGFSVDGTSARMLTPTFGPELAFGAFIAEATDTDNRIAIVKVSRGGSSLRNDWRVNPTVNTGPDVPEGFIYRAFIEEVSARLAELRADGSTAIVKGVVWHQGESDSNNGVNEYVERYIEFVESVRDRFGEDIQFVLGELSRDRVDPDGTDRSVTFNTNINQLAADSADPNNLDVPSGISVVSSLGLETPRSLNPTNFDADGTHFTANGQIELGRRYVAEFGTLEPLPEPEPPAETVLFDFNNGGVVDGDGNDPAPESDSDFDASAEGDTIILGGLGFTVVEVITPEFSVTDGVTARTGNILSGGTTSIGGQNALGFNNPTIGTGAFDALGTTTNNGTEGTDINADESLVFTFDQNVTFTQIVLESFTGVDGFEVRVGGSLIEDDFIDGSNNGAGLGGLENLLITAGTQITFTGTGDDSTTDFRIVTLEVQVVAETSILGDFDQDDDVDVDDIDFYIGNLDTEATGELAQLDLVEDGTITIADLNFHITTLAETSNGVQGALLGDLDLNGQVDVLGDAFALIANLGSNGEISYGLGNINGDLMVDVLGDAFLLIANLGESNDPPASAP